MSRSDVRQKMIRGAADLLSRRGLQATSFSQILELTGAPRGSVYHHFPGGKDEVVTEAVRYVGNGVLSALATEDLTPTEVIARFGAMWRTVLVGSDLRGGCVVAAVTVGADSGELLSLTGAVFGEWLDALAAALHRAGAPESRCPSLAAVVLAGLEGAMVLTRASRSLEPFDDVVAELVRLVEALD